MILYKCDMCGELHELDESKVRNKQYYITPRGCTDDDYYIDAYFWFPCNCGRVIKVEEEGLPNPYGIEINMLVFVHLKI